MAAAVDLAAPPDYGPPLVEGWDSGTSIDSEKTLAFSAQSGVRSMNGAYRLERAAEAYDRMVSGKASVRVGLTMGKLEMPRTRFVENCVGLFDTSTVEGGNRTRSRRTTFTGRVQEALCE